MSGLHVYPDTLNRYPYTEYELFGVGRGLLTSAVGVSTPLAKTDRSGHRPTRRDATVPRGRGNRRVAGPTRRRGGHRILKLVPGSCCVWPDRIQYQDLHATLLKQDGNKLRSSNIVFLGLRRSSMQGFVGLRQRVRLSLPLLFAF